LVKYLDSKKIFKILLLIAILCVVIMGVLYLAYLLFYQIQNNIYYSYVAYVYDGDGQGYYRIIMTSQEYSAFSNYQRFVSDVWLF